MELVSAPWVEKTPEKFRHWVRHQVPKMVYKIFKMFEADPQFRADVLALGEEKYNCDIVKKHEFESYLCNLVS